MLTPKRTDGTCGPERCRKREAGSFGNTIFFLRDELKTQISCVCLNDSRRGRSYLGWEPAQGATHNVGRGGGRLQVGS